MMEQNDTDPNIRYITNSELQSFKQCRRQWWMSYIRRLDKRKSDGSSKAAATGTMVHDALESYYKDPTFNASKAIQHVRSAQAADPNADQFEAEYQLADAMVEGYFEWLEETGADQGLEIVAVEQRIMAPAPGQDEGVQLLGKLDLIARMHSTLLTLDHKTVQGFDGTVTALPMNEQSRHYALIQRHHNPGDPLQGSIWNMLRKVKRSSRSKPPFYARSEIRWNNDQLDTFKDRLTGEIAEMLRVQAMLEDGANHQVVAYPSPSTDCSWRCPFHAVCPLMDDPRTDSEMLIDVMYEQRDPLARYQSEKEEDTNG